MIDFGNSEDRLNIWKKIATQLNRGQLNKLHVTGRPTRLIEIQEFGSNPGNLRMFRYIPSHAPGTMPLVVVLHGCGQTAEGYNYGAGWSTLCDRHGFALLMPEQQRSNNPNGCLNWFQPEDTQRDRGEALSIYQMVQKMVHDGSIDPDRIFVTGLSAGGAMTSVMLACYPDLFAAGAIIAGLPYGAASNVQQAFESMYRCPSRSARYWGDLVRAAGPRSQCAMAPHFRLARQCRQDGHSRQCRRDHQAMDECSRARHSTVAPGHGRRLSPASLDQRCRRRGDRVLQHHAHGAWNAVGRRSSRNRLRRSRPFSARGGHLILVSHREVFRPDW